MPLPTNVDALTDLANQVVTRAAEEHPENPLGLLILAVMKAGRLAGMADAEVTAVLADLQRRNPRPS